MLKRLYACWRATRATAQCLEPAAAEPVGNEVAPVTLMAGIPDHYQADPWVRFMLMGEVAQDHTLSGIIAFNAIEFDTAHDFIQWLFPNRQPSPVNWDAPRLTDLHVEAYAQLPALRQAVDEALSRFFGFLGLEESPGAFTRRDNFEQGSRYWLCPLDHNHRRISRVLTFLCEMGSVERAEKVLRYLVEAMTVQQLQEVSAVRFWVGIVAAYRPALAGR